MNLGNGRKSRNLRDFEKTSIFFKKTVTFWRLKGTIYVDKCKFFRKLKLRRKVYCEYQYG